MSGLKSYISLSLLCLSFAVLQGCSKKGASKKPDETGGKTKSAARALGQSSNSQGGQDQSSKGGAQTNDVVKIPADDQQRAGIRTAAVFVQQVARSLSVAGQVQMDEQHTSHLGMIADGRITSVNVLPGTLVRRGQVLGELHSHAVHETVGALVQAYAAVDRQRGAVVFAKQAQDRYHHLYAIQAASLEESQRSDQEALQTQKMLVDAEASVRMEREHLSELLQVSPESLTPNHLYDKELIPIRSPIDGVVIARNITVGQVVATGFEAFVISNLSTVWITASVNEQDLPLIHVAAVADVTTQAYASHVFRGRVAMIGDLLDPQTRTVPVRVVVPNPGTLLRPGMFASAQIAEPQTRVAIFVPQDALQDINGMKVVFVTRDGTTFEARTVDIGTQSTGKVEIVNGLKSDDHIVVNGAFMVKSEMLKGTMGES
jgi:cobalt-zinc-cadmium efflux system membrane fusion protein